MFQYVGPERQAEFRPNYLIRAARGCRPAVKMCSRVTGAGSAFAGRGDWSRKEVSFSCEADKRAYITKEHGVHGGEKERVRAHRRKMRSDSSFRIVRGPTRT